MILFISLVISIFSRGSILSEFYRRRKVHGLSSRIQRFSSVCDRYSDRVENSPWCFFFFDALHNRCLSLYSYAMGRKKEQEPCPRDSKDFYQRVLKLTIILHDVQHFRFQTNKTKNDRRSWRRSSVNFNERMGKFDSIRKDIQLEKQSPFLTVRVSLIFLTSHFEYLHENSYLLLHRFKDHKTSTKSLNPYAWWILEMRLTLNATVECFLLFFSFFQYCSSVDEIV